MIKFAILIPLLGLLAYYSYKSPRLTSILFWSFLSTTFSCAALLLTVPGVFSEKAITMALCVPLVWVGLQFWCYWDQSQWQVLFGNIALCVVGGVVVVLTEPMI